MKWKIAVTSSGTFSISPFVVSAAFSSFFGFDLSFLLNENDRNDKKRFLDFSFFFLPSAGVAVVFASSAPSTASLLSFSVCSASVPSPFSDGFAVSVVSALSVFASSVAGDSFGASSASSFFSAASSTFSASPFSSVCSPYKQFIGRDIFSLNPSLSHLKWFNTYTCFGVFNIAV